MLRREKQSYMQGLGNANAKHFWKAVKNLTGKSYSTIPTLNYLGKTADTDTFKANMLSEYFDLTKVFDTVPHRALLEKLTSIGLNKYLIKWVASYLTGRKQQVVVNGSCSNFCQ